MRPAWRLATSSLSGRRRRTALLVAAVALSAALIAAVSCAMASINESVRMRLDAAVGRADLQVRPTGTGQTFDASLLGTVRSWPETKAAAGRLQDTVSIVFTTAFLAEMDGRSEAAKLTLRASALALGVSFEDDSLVRPITILAGREAREAGEIVIDAALAERLTWLAARDAEASLGGFTLVAGPGVWETSAPEVPDRLDDARKAEEINRRVGVRVGDEVEIVRLLRRPVRLTVVGIAAQPPLGGRPQAYMTLDGLGSITGRAGRLSEIDAVLREPDRAEEIVVTRRSEMPPGVVLQTSARVTSGVERSIASTQLGLALATFLAFLTATFITFTGMMTDAVERERELAVLRCIGASRGQLGGAQLLVGAVVGGLGGSIGVPLGLLVAGSLIAAFPEQVPAGPRVLPLGICLAFTGALASGVAGALAPAWRASRTSPLRALAARARRPTRRAVVAVTIAGLAGAATHAIVIGTPNDGQTAFWLYVTLGLPAMLTGYFLLGLPAMLLASAAFGPVVSAVLGLPRRLLGRTIRATPFRYGFTAGAMMAGLALMVALWTQGGAVLRDWFGKLKFPDAFVTGLALTDESVRALDALPFVTNTCAITLHPVETDAFGVRALQRYRTTFIAFEPEPFFRMSNLTWVEGDPATAQRRLEAGGAVIVAREFKVAQGMGVGDVFRCEDNGVLHEFEIVGVVTSPGLDVVSKFFNVGDEYLQQAVHAVFGSRRDLRERFGSDAINMIQIDLADDADDADAIRTIRRELFAAGILDAGSGRMIRREIEEFIRGTLLAVSALAVLSMFIACFGVANVIVAGVEARQFEFGVLRALGAQRGLLLRLIAGEALLIASAACLLGTLMGTQGAWGGTRLNALLLGLSLTPRPPLLPIAAGWGFVLLMCLSAAAPSIARLNRRRPCELLAAVRG
ncbi:MAG: hypothetical protein DYG93_12620 [Leptolyngbya sp. PLA2]|nr:hypothetical protein [Leptolyngbya sp.]MCE7972488.1 hypothetical protein [Leptolyngbya sp. PL-A2]MCQ3941129.1 hypothetical protein [cyanobacterium CYA1]MCZ7633195.1 ABC transporter permease [Phycisphaerales bacterium]MDL1905413.1 ABC transporter permease [Synechococcales cyanobacterium CNB]GIK18327.1 MAG: ABC transporter [Planctomycetota bacterium]